MQGADHPRHLFPDLGIGFWTVAPITGEKPMEADLNAQHITHFADLAWNWLEVFLPRIVAAAAILIGGFVAVGWVDRALRRMLAHAHHVDIALKPILISLVRYTALVLVMIGALSQIGIQTTSLLAVIGAAGLAVGLALQGTLSNIAAGMMLLWLRPFQIGDFIEVNGQSGAVEEIGLFVCELRTYDGLYLFVPNSAIWNAALKNYTRNGGRLVTVNVAVPIAANLDRARQTLLDVAARTPSARHEPAPAVFVDNVGGGVMVLNLMVWTTPQGAGTVERAIVEGVKRALEALGENFAPSQIVRATPPDTDPSRYLEGREAA
jgi:small conductance mechanosensitive channel